MVRQTLCLLSLLSLGADWPTYQGDVARSGISRETLPSRLTEVWRYESSPPRPAWPEPARQDFWHDKYGLTASIDFDRAHHVVAADGSIYLGSTVEDTIVCLDAETGERRWVFYTEGPVRLAPSVIHGRVYFGSDDGRAYCVSAVNGSLLWRRRIADTDRRIGGNGRLISAWPLRCGVLVDNNTVYCTAGIFPNYGVWLAALDAKDGSVRWRRRLEEIAPQGYLLASPTRLYVPTGRTSPAVFDRKDGSPIDLSGIQRRGGSFALIADEGLVHRGEGEDQIELQMGSGDRLALFAGRQTIVDGETAYLLDDRKLSALNRGEFIRLRQEHQKLSKAEKAEKNAERQRKLEELAKAMEACWIWKVDMKQSGAMILAKDTIVVGGQNEVSIRKASDGSLLTRLPVEGAAYGLAIANGKLLASTDRGMVHCFAEGVMGEVKSRSESADRIRTVVTSNATPQTLTLAAEPHIRHLAPDRVEITWESDDARPMAARVTEVGDSARTFRAQRQEQDGVARHVAVATGITAKSECSFWIIATAPSGDLVKSRRYAFDSSCDVPPCPRPKVAVDENSHRSAEHIVEDCGSGPGYALLLGDDGRLATELARSAAWRLIVVQPDETNAAEVRARLEKAGIYGTRAVVHCVPFNRLPYASRSIDLVVFDRTREMETTPEVVEEARRVVCPGSGRIWPLERSSLSRTGPATEPLKLRGQWTHLYSDPSGRASNNEPLRGPLQLQWFGRPGPKHMIDRHHRAMSPLVVEGRIFLPGNERLKGIDAYNGTILWDLTLPGFRRVAMMRDSGHLAAQRDEVFAVVHNGCRVIDAATGRWLRTLPLPASQDGTPEYWGYLAVMGDAVLGTSEAVGASYDQHDREIPDRVSYWDDVPVVVGRTLFSLDRQSGTPHWIYKNPKGSVLLHSTIVAGDDRVYFVESRASKAVAAENGRVPLEVACVPGASWLVALDLATGEKLWERCVDLSGVRNVLHAVCAGDTLVLTGTQNDENHPRYDLMGFDTADGSARWANHYVRADKDPNGDHGEQDQHPVVIGRTLYSRPWAFDVSTGEKLDFQLDRGGHGCGGLSGSAHYLFGRGRNPRMYELDSGVQSGTRVTQVTRPGCWINMIAADGLLLIPEASSGCSCAFSIQASIGLAPVD